MGQSKIEWHAKWSPEIFTWVAAPRNGARQIIPKHKRWQQRSKI